MTTSDVWKLFAAIALHAAPILFCIGMEMCSTSTKKKHMIFYIVVVALATPIGVTIGLIVTEHVDDDDAIADLPSQIDTVVDVGTRAGREFGVRIAPIYITVRRAYYGGKDARLKTAATHVRALDWQGAGFCAGPGQNQALRAVMRDLGYTE